MAKSPTLDNQLLQLIFNGTATSGVLAGVAQNGSSPPTQFYIALHTADPQVTAGAGTLNTQNASEVAYGGYLRGGTTPSGVTNGGLVRATTAGTGWTVTGASVSPNANISFPICTSGTATALFWSVGMTTSATAPILYSGPINAPGISISTNVTPILLSTSTITES